MEGKSKWTRVDLFCCHGSKCWTLYTSYYQGYEHKITVMVLWMLCTSSNKLKGEKSVCPNKKYIKKFKWCGGKVEQWWGGLTSLASTLESILLFPPFVFKPYENKVIINVIKFRASITSVVAAASVVWSKWSPLLKSGLLSAPGLLYRAVCWRAPTVGCAQEGSALTFFFFFFFF